MLEAIPDAPNLADLIQTVSVYTGELLPAFYDEWVQLERERLRALFEHRMQDAIDGLVAAERWREVQTWAEHWVALGHIPEPAYRALILAHAALGDLAGMASQYRRCCQTLEEELGVVPSEETQALYHRLSAGEVPHVPAAQRVSPAEAPSTSIAAPRAERPSPLYQSADEITK